MNVIAQFFGMQRVSFTGSLKPSMSCSTALSVNNPWIAMYWKLHDLQVEKSHSGWLRHSCSVSAWEQSNF